MGSPHQTWYHAIRSRRSSRRAGSADADRHRRAAVRAGFRHGFTRIARSAIGRIHAVHEADPAARQLRAGGPLRTVPGVAAGDGANAIWEPIIHLAKALIAIDVDSRTDHRPRSCRFQRCRLGESHRSPSKTSSRSAPSKRWITISSSRDDRSKTAPGPAIRPLPM